MTNNYRVIGIITVTVATIVMAIVISVFLLQNKPSHQSSVLQELGFFLFKAPRQLAPVELSRLSGESASLTDVSQHWQLVNFGYMFCPDICPINLRLLRDIKNQWDQQGTQPPLSITHITFDPERDTPDRLKPYLDYLHKDFIGLTGELKGIRQVAQQLNTVFIHEKPDEYGNYFITHSDSIALLNPAGEYVGLFKGPYDQDKIIEALSILTNPG